MFFFFPDNIVRNFGAKKNPQSELMLILAYYKIVFSQTSFL